MTSAFALSRNKAGLILECYIVGYPLLGRLCHKKFMKVQQTGGGRRNVLKDTVEITLDSVRYVGLIEKPGVKRSHL